MDGSRSRQRLLYGKRATPYHALWQPCRLGGWIWHQPSALTTFAMETYADDPCTLFGPKVEKEDCTYNAKTLRMIGRMHKAISVIQFKLEAEIIRRRPDFEMDDRMLLHRIDFERKTITMPNGKEYELKDSFLPTVNPADPYKLTDEEREIMNKLHRSFVSSEKLKNISAACSVTDVCTR